MSNALTLTQERNLTAVEVRAHVNLIQEVMEAVMKKDTHYGVIPGTQKPTLYKAGTEVLFTTFRIAVEPEVDDLSTPDEIRYRVRAVGRHQITGIVIGVGIGECSSNEDKYKWRKAVCDEEFDETPETRKRIKYAKGRDNSHYTVKQIRTEPSDLANTILKMAKKRAQVDLCLTATAASDIFTQDLEDLPPELRDAADETVTKPPVQKPKRKSENGNGNPATEPQRKMIFAKLKNAGIPTAIFEDEFGKLDDLMFADVNRALDFIKNFEQVPEGPAYE